jgi:hypothetical protein
MSLEMQEAPDVEKVSVQDIEAAASPIALKAIIRGAEAKRSLTKASNAGSARDMPAGKPIGAISGYIELRAIAITAQDPKTTVIMRAPIIIPKLADFASLAAQTFCQGSCSVIHPGIIARQKIRTMGSPIDKGFHQSTGRLPKSSEALIAEVPRPPSATVPTAAKAIAIVKIARKVNMDSICPYKLHTALQGLRKGKLQLQQSLQHRERIKAVKKLQNKGKL